MRKLLAGLLLLAASLAIGGNNAGWTNAGGSLTTQAKSIAVNAVAGSFAPLRVVNFNGLSSGQSVVAGIGSPTAGKTFDWCAGGVAFANGYGVQATTAVHRTGYTSSAAISIAAGSDGDPSGGSTGASYGSFGGGWGLGTDKVVEGEEMWWGMWMFFPSTWRWDAATTQDQIKFLRLDHNAASDHMDIYVLNGQYSYYGNGDSSSAASDKQSGTWFANEYGTGGYTEPATKVTAGLVPLNQWVWVEEYVYAHSDPLQAKRRLWINGVFAREQVGNAIKWRASDGVLRTITLTGGQSTLQNSTDYLTNLRLFTYWNHFAPQNQTAYVSDMVFHKNPATLPATDEFGNKMIGSSAF